MKKISVVISIDKVWDACRQWTSNRAFLQDNPNVSRQTLNYTYAITEDEKEQFFRDYLELSVSELVVGEYLRRIQKYNSTAFYGEDSDFDFDNNKITLNFCVGERFPAKEFGNFVCKWLQWKVLYYWYWEKCLNEEFAKLVYAEIKRTESLIKAVVNKDYSNGNGTSDRIPYNDGFVINPPMKKDAADVPKATDDAEKIKIGTITSEPTIETKEVWSFIEDLPKEIFVSNEGDEYALVVSFTRSYATSYKDYSYINVVLHEGKQTKSVLYDRAVNLPIKIEDKRDFKEQQECYYEVFLRFADGRDEKILESVHCTVQQQDNGVYGEIYTQVYN